mmetsp:Transcript_25352/g.78196  ORF Transcript_25352/g.78196 Transcript_25352/m.78196 type:complete len:211 (-) Transcript_25352:61-693(-)
MREYVSALCAFVSIFPVLCPLTLLPHPRLKLPRKTKYGGRLTFLTFQSNMIMLLYHHLRAFAPDAYLAVHAYPLAFAAGVGLTLMYYALDHFVPAKIALDNEWVAKGWSWIPIGNHVQHGLALPVALVDGLYGGHAGQTSMADVVLFVGGYTLVYLVWTVVNKYLTGLWVYDIFDVAESKLGVTPGFLCICVPVVSVYCALGVLGLVVAG